MNLVTIKGLISSRRGEQPSIVKEICAVDLIVCPIFAIDFSVGNHNERRHSTAIQEPNEYREAI